MADYLPDTNLLLRLGDTNSPLYTVTHDAINILRARGDRVYIVPQNLYEFYAVVTRPASARGGLNLTPTTAKAEMNRLRGTFIFRADTADVFTEWANLVDTYGVSGVQAHDVRIVAAMRVHGISNLLTFNTVDFVRYPFVNVIYPDNV